MIPVTSYWTHDCITLPRLGSGLDRAESDFQPLKDVRFNDMPGALPQASLGSEFIRQTQDLLDM